MESNIDNHIVDEWLEKLAELGFVGASLFYVNDETLFVNFEAINLDKEPTNIWVLSDVEKSEINERFVSGIWAQSEGFVGVGDVEYFYEGEVDDNVLQILENIKQFCIGISQKVLAQLNAEGLPHPPHSTDDYIEKEILAEIIAGGYYTANEDVVGAQLVSKKTKTFPKDTKFKVLSKSISVIDVSHIETGTTYRFNTEGFTDKFTYTPNEKEPVRALVVGEGFMITEPIIGYGPEGKEEFVRDHDMEIIAVTDYNVIAAPYETGTQYRFTKMDILSKTRPFKREVDVLDLSDNDIPEANQVSKQFIIFTSDEMTEPVRVDYTGLIAEMEFPLDSYHAKNTDDSLEEWTATAKPGDKFLDGHQQMYWVVCIDGSSRHAGKIFEVQDTSGRGELPKLFTYLEMVKNWITNEEPVYHNDDEDDEMLGDWLDECTITDVFVSDDENIEITVMHDLVIYVN